MRDFWGAVLSADHGGQVLLSEATAALVRDTLSGDLALIDLGEQRLKDLTRPERVFQLVARDLPASFPPLASLDARPHNLPHQTTTLLALYEALGARDARQVPAVVQARFGRA